MAFKKVAFLIAGNEMVEGYARAGTDLAAAKEHKDWNIYHIPTGWTVYGRLRSSTLAVAKIKIDALLALPIAWDELTVDTIGRDLQPYKDEIMRIATPGNYARRSDYSL